MNDIDKVLFSDVLLFYFICIITIKKAFKTLLLQPTQKIERIAPNCTNKGVSKSDVACELKVVCRHLAELVSDDGLNVKYSDFFFDRALIFLINVFNSFSLQKF